MFVYKEVGDICVEMFLIWLDFFDKVLVVNFIID